MTGAFRPSFGVDVEETSGRVPLAYERLAHRCNARGEPAGGFGPACRRCPEFGGDTTFTNLVAATKLSAPVQAFVETLRAEHRYGANWQGLPDLENEYGNRIEKNRLVAIHPVVRVHPRTGERALFVNPGFVDHIVGVSPLESRWILEHLFNELLRPDMVRFRWEPGSVAFWDNRATATSPLTTSTTSTASRGCCTGSRSSAKSPLVLTVENQSSLKASRLSRRRLRCELTGRLALSPDAAPMVASKTASLWTVYSPPK